MALRDLPAWAKWRFVVCVKEMKQYSRLVVLRFSNELALGERVVEQTKLLLDPRGPVNLHSGGREHCIGLGISFGLIGRERAQALMIRL